MKGTVREKGESSRLPKNEHLTGSLEHHHQPPVPTLPYQGTGGEGEDGLAKDPAMMDAADCQADCRERRKERTQKREEWPLIRPLSAKTGDKGSQIVARRRPWFSNCENTKPKTSFVEPQGTTTPNHLSSKPFARHTNTNQPRRMAVFQSLSICYF